MTPAYASGIEAITLDSPSCSSPYPCESANITRPIRINGRMRTKVQIERERELKKDTFIIGRD